MTTKNFVQIISFFFVTNLCAQDYKNSSLSPHERAISLTSYLTLDEKIGLLTDYSRPVERLGIKTYNWWNEALHGVGRAGLATVFPQPIGMAASFNPELINEVFTAVSDEARAKYTQYAKSGEIKRYQGLTMWTPNVNIFRDPRWGRGIETYGEDPYLTSVLGVQVVKGLQGPGNTKYDKLHACAKHYAVHSGPEWNRHSFNVEQLKKRDLYETYLPAFKSLVTEAKVKEVMCAYNAFEGDPCCGSNLLLTKILRNDWKFEGIVVSDCGAIADFFNDKGHKVSKSATEGSAKSLLSGTDLDCGSSYRALIKSVMHGLVSEKDIDVAVIRLLKARFELGELDDLKDVSWSNIPLSVVGSEAHNALALKIAQESIVLLKNQKNILPLKPKNKIIALTGPNANDSVMQWGNYHGTPGRTSTLLSALSTNKLYDYNLIYEKGCGLVENTMLRSIYGDCSNNNLKGFTATYWNNLTKSGNPVAKDQLVTPLRFTTAGATTFCPGVELTDFSAQYNSKLVPQQSGEITFDFYVCGKLVLYVNGVERKAVQTNHGSRRVIQKLKVNAGETYDIQLDYNYVMGDAQLNFDLGFNEEMNIQKSIEKLKNSDIVIFAGGISPSLEGEEMNVNVPGFKGGDRTNIELPDVQKAYLKALYEAGKKVVFVNFSGSPISMVDIDKYCCATLQAWYPGQAGGQAIANVLFGKYNPAAKLPLTFYKNINQLPEFENYNVEGRTYRYLRSTPEYPFGYGLSYSKFSYGNPNIFRDIISVGDSLEFSVPVKNTSKRDGEETVQVYLKKLNDPEGPNKTLRAFQKITIAAHTTKTYNFKLSPQQLEWWDEAKSEMSMHPGDYELQIGTNSSDVKTLSFKIQ